MEIDLDEMIGAESILEDHVSRVWDNQAMTENVHDSFLRSVSAQLPAKPFHRRLLQPVHPSPNVSGSGLGYSFNRFPSRLSATSSFCQPDLDVSCCSEMDCSIDDDQRLDSSQRLNSSQQLNSLPDRSSSMSRHRLIHSTPKSKSHVLTKYTTSQSDSEMWDDCGSSVEQRSGSKAWSTSSECMGCSSCHAHYSSQPDLPAAVAHTE